MWTLSKARNRKGFTLIELMIVIAIIIILAAIAIPSYLHFVDRAKKAKAAANMGNIAQYLATFNTDWSVFPYTSSTTLTEPITNAGVLYAELTGADANPATVNLTGKTTVTGENGPITYINGAKLLQLGKNPWVPTAHIYYEVNGNGTHWTLYVKMGTANASKYLYRTDGSENLTTTSGGTTAPGVAP